MKSVYFVRHGQTVWNVENKICGATDIELTALGHEQAIETGKKILEKKIEADVILYSPLVRAKDTALHISEITGIPAKEEMRLKSRISESMNRPQEMVPSFVRQKSSLSNDMKAVSRCFSWRSVCTTC